MAGRIIIGSVTDDATWSQVPDQSVHVMICSPPYHMLRDYGTAEWEGGDDPACDHKKADRQGQTGERATRTTGHTDIYSQTCPKCSARRIDAQLGLEATVDEFVANQVAVFGRAREKLRADGTLWVNIAGGMPDGQEDSAPERFKLAMQADGWLCRSTIIWAKAWETDDGGDGSVMPESVAGWRWTKCRVKVKAQDSNAIPSAKVGRHNVPGAHASASTPAAAVWHDCPGCDKCAATGGYVLRKGSWRPTKASEMIYMFAKTRDYFCNGEAGKVAYADSRLGDPGEYNSGYSARPDLTNRTSENRAPKTGRNRRSVWRINTASFPGEFCAACQTYYESEYNDLKTVKVNGRKVKKCVCGATDGWVSHFATFPLELPLTIIPIATSEKGVCAKCGSPWAPKVDSPTGGSTGKSWHDHTHDQDGNRKDASSKGYVPSRITGWMQTCTCQDAGEPVPATVCDIFSGAGTSGVAAVKLGREYLGLELSPIYAEMSRQRLARAANPTTFSKADAPDDAPLLALMGEGGESR